MDAKLEQKALVLRLEEQAAVLDKYQHDRDSNKFDGLIADLKQAARALTQQGGGVEGFVMVPEPLVRFLLGEDSFGGVWFGDPQPGDTKRYWWRKNLREFITTPTPEATRSGEGEVMVQTVNPEHPDLSTEIPLADLLGEAERVAANLKKTGHYLAATLMRTLAALAASRGEGGGG